MLPSLEILSMNLSATRSQDLTLFPLELAFRAWSLADEVWFCVGFLPTDIQAFQRHRLQLSSAPSPAGLCGHRQVTCCSDLPPATCLHYDFTTHSENMTTSLQFFFFGVWLFLGPLFPMSILETGLSASTKAQIRGCQTSHDKAG